MKYRVPPACRTLFQLLSIAILVAVARGSEQQDPGLLRLEKEIPLPGVEGRIDHFSVDTVGNRIFIAALGNGTIARAPWTLSDCVTRIILNMSGELVRRRERVLDYLSPISIVCLWRLHTEKRRRQGYLFTRSGKLGNDRPQPGLSAEPIRQGVLPSYAFGSR